MFLVKMILTVFLWIVPLLFFRISFLEAQFHVSLQSIAVLIKVLGAGYVALFVNHGFGYAAKRNNAYPRGVVWTGIVSNGGAFLLLYAYQHT